MFEEVKEMIDSTIYTNGRGEVTAQNINLAMHGMVDATEEKFGEVGDAVKAVEDKVTALEENGIGGGSGALKVWMPIEDVSTELTPEQIAENVATYNEIVKGEPVSVVLCQGGSVDGMTVAGTIPTTASYTDLGSNKMVVLLANQIFDREIASITGRLCSDGSAVMVTKTFDVPAPSGPLRVWINEENTPEQVAENAATYTALKNNIAQQVCFVSTPIIDPDTLEAVVYASYSVESIQRADSDNGFYLTKQSITDNDGTVGVITIAVLLLEDGTLEYVSEP